MKREHDELAEDTADLTQVSSEGSRLKGPDAYRNKTILAPMVRVGTLPMRLLALEYGADIVYSEEIIAKKFAKCLRTVDEKSKRVEFVLPGHKKKNVVFSTCAADRPTVFQMGTSDSVSALRAAELVCRDVDAIDVNMGCPKHFSISGGMGAALLSKPDTIQDIMTTLSRNISIPITAKVRMLDSIPASVGLLRLIQQTGAAAVAVHARRIPERPKDPARWTELKEVLDAANLDIPVIVNGDVFCFADIQRARETTGASSVMIGRGAMADPSIFRPETVVPYEVHREYLRKCVECDNVFQNTKYTLLRMHTENPNMGLQNEIGQALVKAKTYEDICKLWGLAEWHEEWKKARGDGAEGPETSSKRPRTQSRDDHDNDPAQESTKE